MISLHALENWRAQGAPQEKRIQKCVENYTSRIPECTFCKSGNLPGGAHRCIICKKAIHMFPECSEPVNGSEEGFSQQRICTKCALNSTSNTNTSIENDEIPESENCQNTSIKPGAGER